MSRFKGIIALDIDGTITTQKYILEVSVSNFLNQLIADSWQLIFLTGRTLSFTRPILTSIRGHYFVAVQNGAAFFSMPEERLVKKYYLSADLIGFIDIVFLSQPGGLLVESGFEREDVCFYKPSDFTAEELKYLDFRMSISPEKWVATTSFQELDLHEFAVGKYFASEKSAQVIAHLISQIPDTTFNILIIRDPFKEDLYLAHVNNEKASKGRVLDYFISRQEERILVIAAGDDYNDVEMLEKSTVKIVMKNAPQPLHAIADIIAPLAEEEGIIPALKEAIGLYGRHH